MSLLLLFPYYLIWHYSKALVDLKNLWKNFIVFFYEFFSLTTLVSTLFSPWHRMQDSYSKELNFENTVGTFIVNSLMRIVGAFVRLIFIIIGLVSIVFTIFFGLIVFCLWIVMPLILFYTIMTGFAMLIP